MNRRSLKSKTGIESWIKRESAEKQRALETASRHFNQGDALDVHTLEAIYATESSFGQNRGERNSSGAAGDFQIKKKTAEDLGLKVDSTNDERFDIDHAAAAAAKQLKKSDHHFEKPTVLVGKTKTLAVEDSRERKKFAIAAYNAGDARIAKAQNLARRDGEDPTEWEIVKNYLEAAGASKRQADETRDYVDKILDYEKEFAKKSRANAKAKFERTRQNPEGGHWVTIDGRHILIRD